MARAKKTVVKTEEQAPSQTPARTVGYIRISPVDQNTVCQLEGVKLDKVFEEKCSAKDTQRPQLQAMLEYVQPGDTIVVHSLDRLARNLRDLHNLLDEIAKKGATVKFSKENLTYGGGRDSSISELTLNLLGAFAQFERELIRERQREGIAAAKARGAYTGRKRKLSEERIKELEERFTNGDKMTQLAKEFKISRETLYKYTEKVRNNTKLVRVSAQPEETTPAPLASSQTNE
jgi:DNA invertase Pin-like site-specific DNA recombinase